MKLENQELLTILHTRNWFYHFFAQSFWQSPNSQWINQYLEQNLFERLNEIGDDSQGLIEIINGLAEMKQYDQEQWAAVNAHYIELFAASGPILVHPWESVYRSKERIIMDEHTLAVREFYRKWGIEVEDRTKGPEDHIGLEFMFMHYLIGKAIEHIEQDNLTELEENLKAQQEFLRNHTIKFLNDFCSKLAQEAKLDLYKGLALYLPQYIATDIEILGLYIEELQNTSRERGQRNV